MLVCKQRSCILNTRTLKLFPFIGPKRRELGPITSIYSWVIWQHKWSKSHNLLETRAEPKPRASSSSSVSCPFFHCNLFTRIYVIFTAFRVYICLLLEEFSSKFKFMPNCFFASYVAIAIEIIHERALHNILS